MVCAALLEFLGRSWRKGRPQGKPRGLKGWKIATKTKNYGMQQNFELQCREIMDIGNKNTSGQASRQASRASSLWKLGQNNMTKKGPFFWSSKRNKKQAHKMGLPSKRSNTALCGNQGSPQPGAPEITQCKPYGYQNSQS